MNPALSVIVFSTASGAGYGLLALLGLLFPWLPHGRWFALAAGLVSLGLITGGLLCSTAHLGRPERAWRAVSQWRSSWLAREGLAALATYLPAGLLLLVWLVAGRPTAAAFVLGPLAALGAAATVCCTAMIYASLKPIRQWRQRLVLPGYVVFAVFSGALALAAVAACFPGRHWWPALLALVAGLLSLAAKWRYWGRIDAPAPAGTPTTESATGLGRIGRTRPLDAPHTEENYLLREMGYVVARRHALKLRRIALGFMAAATLLALVALIPGLAAASIPGAVAALAGLLVERWLFFAQATHTVTLYYRRAA